MIFASILLFLASIFYALFTWVRFKMPEATTKCADCGQYRRHNEPPHEITGCTVGGFFQYIEKGANREHRTIGFVRASTPDERDKQTVENILAEMDNIAERDRQENFKRQCYGRVIRTQDIAHRTIGDPDADRRDEYERRRDLARQGRLESGPQVERSYYSYAHRPGSNIDFD